METLDKKRSTEERVEHLKEVNEPHKIHCEECDGYKDCPRMRGNDYCLGGCRT